MEDERKFYVGSLMIAARYSVYYLVLFHQDEIKSFSIGTRSKRDKNPKGQLVSLPYGWYVEKTNFGISVYWTNPTNGDFYHIENWII